MRNPTGFDVMIKNAYHFHLNAMDLKIVTMDRMNLTAPTLLWVLNNSHEFYFLPITFQFLSILNLSKSFLSYHVWTAFISYLSIRLHMYFYNFLIYVAISYLKIWNIFKNIFIILSANHIFDICLIILSTFYLKV